MRVFSSNQFFLVLFVIGSFTSLSLAQGSRLNKDAQALAKQLAPSGPAKSFNPQGIGPLGKRMIGAIQVLEKSYRTNGPNPESLIPKALSFRKDLGHWEKLLLTNALLDNWRAANAMGLFDESGKFQVEVSEGRGIGSRTLFELVVPGETFPPASNQLANLKLIREDQKRDPKAPLSTRENAVLSQLQKLMEEKKNLAERAKWDSHKMDALGQTKEDRTKVWENAMTEAGEKAKELPNIRVQANLEATPSHSTKQRWRIGCEVGNLSTHPTEAKMEVWLLGYTDKKRDHYIMAKSDHVLKLRSGETTEIDVFTKSERSYKNKADDHDELSKQERKKSRVRYRGFAIKITHEKGVVSFTGSDQALENYVNPANLDSNLGSLPKF